MTEASEQELIRKAQQGDHRAFRVLVEAHQGLVYSIAFRLTRHQGEAEDLTQETFVRLWNNLGHYKPEHRLKSWVGKIATNLALDHLRLVGTKHRKGTVPLEHAPALQNAKPSDGGLHAEELHALVLQLSEQLSPKQRMVFVLRDLEQLEVDEVKVMLSMSASNIKSNLFYARSAMKELLKKFYP